MAENNGMQEIPGRALPAFGRGAFRGSVVPRATPVNDMRYADDAPFAPPRGFVVTPVNPTNFSAGNKVRLGVVGVMLEWWAHRPISNGQIFVADPATYTRHVSRRMGRVRRLTKIVPNQQVTYSPQSYGAALPKRKG